MDHSQSKYPQNYFEEFDCSENIASDPWGPPPFGLTPIGLPPFGVPLNRLTPNWTLEMYHSFVQD